MTIKSVTIDEGCISCGLCAEICPDVFEIDGTAKVIKGADLSVNEEEIKRAAESCPVGVIKTA